MPNQWYPPRNREESPSKRWQTTQRSQLDEVAAQLKGELPEMFWSSTVSIMLIANLSFQDLMTVAAWWRRWMIERLRTLRLPFRLATIRFPLSFLSHNAGLLWPTTVYHPTGQLRLGLHGQSNALHGLHFARRTCRTGIVATLPCRCRCHQCFWSIVFEIAVEDRQRLFFAKSFDYYSCLHWLPSIAAWHRAHCRVPACPSLQTERIKAMKAGLTTTNFKLGDETPHYESVNHEAMARAETFRGAKKVLLHCNYCCCLVATDSQCV